MVATPEDLPLLKVPEAARMLRISPRTLWAITAAGDLPAVQIAKRIVRYRSSDLVAYAGRALRSAKIDNK